MSTIKKILAILLSAVLCLAAFTALAESSETPVTINFWHHYSAQSAENETLMNVLIGAKDYSTQSDQPLMKSIRVRIAPSTR